MTPTRAAVLGRPIGHSLSPLLHRAAYRELGLDWTYEALDCGTGELAGLLDRLASTHAGVSLTMPLKEAVVALVDRPDDDVRAVGAANTVVFGDGGRRAHNTDIAGTVAALQELGVPVPAAAAVLGAGGAARAAIAALARCGTRSVSVYLRDVARGGALVALGERHGIGVVLEPWATARTGVRAVDLVVATTPAGATDGVAAAGWRAGTALLDVVYAPWPTRVAATAAAAGAPVVGGLSLLVAQAAEQVRLMTGHAPPVPAMRAAGEQALRARGR